jgi:hypothetical protein
MSTRFKYNGITSYTPEEADNVSLGQGGFDILVGAANSTGIEYVASDREISSPTQKYLNVPNGYWVAIKAITVGAVADSSIIAETLIGDDLMLNPKFGYSSSGNTHNIDLQAEDVISGCFTKIRICDAASYIKAYRG